MHRIFHQLGWTDDRTHSRGPDATRVALESFVPPNKWPEINLLFVGFGQQAQQHRIKVLRRVCGTDPQYPDFPEAESVTALKILGKVGGVPSALGLAYILKAKETGTGETPLMWAAASGWRGTVVHLLSIGCNAKTVDCGGKTASAHAAACGHGAIASILLKAEKKE